MAAETDPAARIRLDKWLWYARLIKTRTGATDLCRALKVRVNGTHAQKPSKLVGHGDVITMARGNQILTLEILAPGTRRGPASEAQTLYRDLTPAPEQKNGDQTSTPDSGRQNDLPSGHVSTQPLFERAPGSGRPVKRERRALDRLRRDMARDGGSQRGNDGDHD